MRQNARIFNTLLLLTLLVFVTPLAARGEEPIATSPLLPAGYRSIKVYDREGRFVGRLLPEGRRWVTLDRIPPMLKSALVAVEDARFYEHGGIDLRGIARALVKDVVAGKLVEGGSTITQQLVKNKHLTAEKTLDRKVKEGVLAREYEKKYSKEQILEMYFNEIYYGNGAWGIAQAAQIYFDKSPEELNEIECVTLAGTPKNPGRYNPRGKAVDLEQRRSVVLKRLADLKLITPQQQSVLRRAKLTLAPPGQVPQYLAHVRSKLIDRYGPQIIENGGLDVTAALDLNLQKLAEQTLRDGVKKLAPGLQGALIAIDPLTGDILAAVGSLDAAAQDYNRALFARRQPGSAIKPLIYAAAIDQGITPVSRWDDTPVSYPRGGNRLWTPRNYGGEKFGSLTLHEALTHSNNVVTVKLLDTVGVPWFVDFSARLGLTLRSPNDLSLALGTDDVTLHDLTLAYAPLANGGLLPASRTIVRIEDRRHDGVVENPAVLTPVLESGTAFVTEEMLRSVLLTGTARGLKRFAEARPAAGKTGTTDDYRDAWFIGFTPQIVAGVWVGYDKPKPGGRGFTGGAIAAPIWERFMRPALAAAPVLDFVQPESVVSLAVDPTTGYLMTPGCPEEREEYFLLGSEPEPCPEHGGIPVAEESIPTEGIIWELPGD